MKKLSLQRSQPQRQVWLQNWHFLIKVSEHANFHSNEQLFHCDLCPFVGIFVSPNLHDFTSHVHCITQRSTWRSTCNEFHFFFWLIFRFSQKQNHQKNQPSHERLLGRMEERRGRCWLVFTFLFTSVNFPNWLSVDIFRQYLSSTMINCPNASDCKLATKSRIDICPASCSGMCCMLYVAAGELVYTVYWTHWCERKSIRGPVDLSIFMRTK